MMNRLCKQIVSVVLAVLTVGLMAFQCDDCYDASYDKTMKNPCQIHVRNLSERKVQVCVAGLIKDAGNSTGHRLSRPIFREVTPGLHGAYIDVYAVEYDGMGNQTKWYDYFSEGLEVLYLAVADSRKNLEKWLEMRNDSLLLDLHEWTADSVQVNMSEIEYVYYGPENY